MATSAPKRIILCCDGSWQSADNGQRSTPSNIARLTRLLERAGLDDAGTVWQQLVWYDSGVGTSASWVGRVADGNFTVAAALEENVLQAYTFCTLNYSPGDQIFIFGFSRGAYTARSIAGLIADIGLCEPRMLGQFYELWELYKSERVPGERFYGSDAYWEWIDGRLAEKQPTDLGYRNSNIRWDRHPHGDWAVDTRSRNIELVGVYDTVGALGLPDFHGWKVPLGEALVGKTPTWHNVALSRNIRHAYHALALDEHRQAFKPTMWHIPPDIESSPDKVNAQTSVVEDAYNKWYSVLLDTSVEKSKKQELYQQLNNARRELITLEEAVKPKSKLKQVWFSGYHISIGGGSTNTLKNLGDLEEMSNITFAWMLDRIRPFLALRETVFYQDTRERQDHIDALNEATRLYSEAIQAKKDATAKESWAQWTRRSVAAAASAALHPFAAHAADASPNLQRRDYGWGTGTIIDSYNLFFKVVNGSERRTPGKYFPAASSSGDALGDIGPEDEVEAEYVKHARTHEYIHPTVGFRERMLAGEKEELRYRPNGLPEDKFVRRTRSRGGFEYNVDGAVLPEWRIEPDRSFAGGPSFERLVVAGDAAVSYLRELDAANGFASTDGDGVAA
ncbi:hypothetical protein BX600DRAFT_63428 [Xylariales sp. PMI_506]|nr:hypothetical protein BX600DRAFT_63428 [Xylariales sp. PMI_506]